MIVQLTEEWVDHLRSLPESGMGYQVVDVTLHDGQRLPSLLVFNAEQLQAPGSVTFGPQDIARITLRRSAER